MVEVEHEIIIYKGIYIWNHTGNYMGRNRCIEHAVCKRKYRTVYADNYFSYRYCIGNSRVFGFTFIKNKMMSDQYGQIERGNFTVNSSSQVIQQGKREQAAVRPVSPLDQVPISAQKKGMPAMARISYVALIGEQGNELLKWSLEGKTAIVIGKGTEAEPVDIDLSGSAMAQMISKQHAVLNYTDNGWYVDDIDSRNGTRVKKKNQSALLDVKLVGAVEVEAGDIIYIANAMLQLR